MELTKKDFKLVTRLYKKLKSVGIDVSELMKNATSSKLIIITDSDIKEFVSGYSGEELEKFNALDEEMKKKVVKRVKERELEIKFAIDAVDKLMEVYEDIETELDSILKSVTGKSQEEVDEMKMGQFKSLAISIIRQNKDVFTH